jgi:hypothetical protein
MPAWLDLKHATRTLTAAFQPNLFDIFIDSEHVHSEHTQYKYSLIQAIPTTCRPKA